MKLFKPQHISWVLCLAIGGCQAASPKPDTSAWKAECVGHYNIGLPGELEIALVNPNLFFKRNHKSWQFNNGDSAPYSFSYAVTPEINKTEFGQIKRFVLSTLEKNVSEMKMNNLDVSAEKLVPSKDDSKFIWISKDSATILSYQGGRIYSLSRVLDNFLSNDLTNESYIKSRFNAFSPRALFELPTVNPSICIPYGYIKQETFEEAGIGITYRLKNHPEIEIMLREAAFQEDFSEQEELEMVWDFFRKRVDDKVHDGREHGFQDVKLAGYSGKGIYVKITREDDTLDYGYAAVVKASNKHPDNPNLLFYITRTAKRAVGEPMSESEFKQLIEGVVGSIQKR